MIQLDQANEIFQKIAALIDGIATLVTVEQEVWLYSTITRKTNKPLSSQTVYIAAGKNGIKRYMGRDNDGNLVFGDIRVQITNNPGGGVHARLLDISRETKKGNK
jgi:hypothetical protein